MKARKVKGLDPLSGLADNAERLALVRLDELYGFIPDALDPEAVEALHAMRIAAKRLRYVLEATATPCFGEYAHQAARHAKALQDVLGDIHDCDVQRPRVTRLAAELRAQDAAELRHRANGAADLDPELAARLPNSAAWSGLAALDAHLRVRRELRHEQFVTLWHDLEREGFRARLDYALRERPAA
jgi:CHAD domain-containing protein